MAGLSEKCVRRLRKATVAACTEVQQLGRLAEMRKLVLDVVYSALQEQARLYTAEHSDVRELPDEVLVEIFGLLPLWDRVRAATVCHKWRDVSLGAAVRLWKTVPSEVRNLDACATLLERAGNFPVTWQYPNMDSVSGKAFSSVLAAHMHHIRVLDFGLPDLSDDADLAWQLAKDLKPAFRASAPILESVRIVDSSEIYPADGPGLPILAARTLRTIDLHGLPPACLNTCAGSATLSSLKLFTPEGEKERMLRPGDWSMICSFPGLERLAIKMSIDIFSRYTWESPLPRSLRHLHLAAEWGIVHAILEANSDSFESLASCRVSFPRSMGMTGLASLLGAVPVEPVSASFWVHDPRVSLAIVSQNGQQIFIQNALYEYVWGMPLAHLTQLCLGGFASSPFNVGRTHEAATLPVLEDLTLDLTPVSRLAHDAHPRLHIWPRMACPSLRVLAVRSSTDRPPIALTDFVFFLEKTLGIQGDRARRIPKLIFDRVSVEPPRGGDVRATLRKYAKKVSMEQSSEIWPECQSAWNKSWGEL